MPFYSVEIKTIKVQSDFEAIITEAELIRKAQPKYNIQAKDDKTPIYITITKENYPRVLLARKTFVERGFSAKNIKLKSYYGPFPSAQKARQLIKFIRKIFPFCQQKLASKPCIYTQMGLCNPCPSFIQKQPPAPRAVFRRQYLKNIKRINAVLSGKLKYVQKDLEKEMNAFAKSEDYESANQVKSQLQALQFATQTPISAEAYLGNPQLLHDIRRSETIALTQILSQATGWEIKSLYRIECFDIAHLSGTFPTASMVTMINATPDKKFYRHFRIHSAKKSDDLSAIKEVIKRRSNHFDSWGKPNLIIIDGGRGQLQYALDALSAFNIKVIGIEKRTESIVYQAHGQFKRLKLPDGPAKNLIQRARDEAHRFARRYHHHLLSKSLFPANS